MASSELLGYIQENKGKFEKSALIETLTRAGWPIADIDAAFAAVEKIPAPPPVAPVVSVPTPASSEPAQDRPIGSIEPRPGLASASATSVVPPPLQGSSAPATPVAQPTPRTATTPENPLQGASSPVTSVMPQASPATPAQPEFAPDPNTAFLAEMARHRKAAAQASEEVVGGSMKVSITQGQAANPNSITGKLITWGIAKDEQQANIVLAGTAILIGGIFLWYFL